MPHFLIPLLAFAAIVGVEFDIAPGITYGDIFCGILFAIVIAKFVRGSLKVDRISKYTLGYVLVIGLSGLINGTFSSTVYLNYYRCFTEGWIVYIAVISSISDKKDYKAVSILFFLFALYFIFYSRNMLVIAAVELPDIKGMVLDYGRNNWGFSCLLLIIALSFVSFRGRLTHGMICLLILPVLVFFVIFSASRFAIISLAFFILFSLYWEVGQWVTLRNLLLVGAIAFCAYFYIFPLLETIVGSDMLSSSFSLFQDKIKRAGEDAVDLRVVELNIRPIQDAYRDNGVLQLFFGDGITVTHGILSQIFVSTGIVGCVYFLIYNFKIIATYIKRGVNGQFLSIVVLIMFLNDFFTNTRFMVSRNTMLYMLILAYVESYLCLFETRQIQE